MVLGNSETIPISNGQLCIGTWQVGCTYIPSCNMNTHE
jgi:thiamine phosphate synthase YjbQ (UPF0047 family)